MANYNDNREYLNDEVTELDNNFSSVIQDPTGEIKQLKVVSQEEYNTNETRNDVLYFINNINDQIYALNNIIDVALSNYDSEDGQPNKIWVLIADYEMAEIQLVCGDINGGPYTLKKRWTGFTTGAITFDGVWDFEEENTYATLRTNSEPFVALINEAGKLYLFPSLKYRVDGSEVKHNQAIVIESSTGGNITLVSVEKGYGSKLYKSTDLGVVISYVDSSNGTDTAYYDLYSYIDETSDTKTLLNMKRRIFSEERIYSMYLRRLSDYCLGLTYNYQETVEGQLVNKVGFRFSKKFYSGIAFHPEYFALEPTFKVGPIMYGAVRTDNSDQVPLPQFELLNERELLTRNLKPELKFKLAFNGEPINLQVLNPKNPLVKTNSLTDIYASSAFEIENDYPYEFFLNNGVPSKAVVKQITLSEDTVYLTLDGDVMPDTPFKIIPTFKNDSDNINIRYDALNLSTMEVSGQKLSKINGWFAFLNGLSFEYEGKGVIGASVSSDYFNLVTIGFNSNITSSAYTTAFSNAAADILQLNLNHYSNYYNLLGNVILITKDYTANSITIQNSFSYTNTLGVVRVIDV